jgi:hypothetical protein
MSMLTDKKKSSNAGQASRKGAREKKSKIGIPEQWIFKVLRWRNLSDGAGILEV